MTRRKTAPLVVHKVDTVTLKLQLKIPLTMDRELSLLARREAIRSMQNIWCRIGEKETRQLLDVIESLYCNELTHTKPQGKVFFKFEESSDD